MMPSCENACASHEYTLCDAHRQDAGQKQVERKTEVCDVLADTHMQDGDDAPPDPGPAVFQLIRFWSRRWVFTAADDLLDDRAQIQTILVLEAVSAATGSTKQASIPGIAAELGVDRSGASRMVRDAERDGYLRRNTIGNDRRRVLVELSTEGARLLEASRAWQQAQFDTLVHDWSQEDVAAFGRLLQRFLTASRSAR